MTLSEVIKAYQLEDFEKSYRTRFGMSKNPENLDKLMNMPVKYMHIDLIYKKATFTIDDLDENMTFKELREASGLNLTRFSRVFDIPYRTAQHWDAGDRECPKYLLALIRYKLGKDDVL